ncbi:cell wall-binding repeat-containing protein [Clostridium nigeriense]|uniref:cell wall-binding repeat-containing protein n=1 Tax=Clostridium nigeriense TaxID=1805470 RepID=UPI003D33EB53
MKKLASIILLIVLIIPVSIPMADDKFNNGNIYNYMMDNGVALGKDNLAENVDDKTLIQMSNGASKTINNIVIVIRFKGEEEFMNMDNFYKLSNTYNMYEDINYDNVADEGSISLNSYISDLTYGQVKVKSSFYPVRNNKYFSIEAPETRDYYEKYVAGSRKEAEFIKWAFDEIKNEINLSENELDQDNDGEIDIVTFLCSGATTSNNMLWPHETKFIGDTSINGKKLGTYNLINVGNFENNIFNKGNLKIAIHEFLHGFSYPDLYRYYYRGNPVGEWDVMANTDGYGQLPLVYTRNFYSNLNLNIQEINSDGVYILKSSQSTNKDDTLAFKIKSPLSDTEYFMVEFRKKEGNWDSALPGSGLIVYRINENVNPFEGNRNGSPDHIYVFREGDTNSYHAQGNTRTAFLSKESGRTSIGSVDLSGKFVSNSLFFDSGENSGIVISEVGSSNGDEISFKVTFHKESEDVEFKSIIGKDRYETAVKLSEDSFESSNSVILVNGLALADGLAITPLASYLNAPILLSRKDSVPEKTINEIKRIGAENVIIVGGEAVLSNKIYSELNKVGIKNIKRLAGNNRYETSLEIAKYIDSNYYNIEDIVVSNGLTEADAMSIASIAAREKMPIILSNSKELEKSSYNWLKNQNLKNAYIIGGETALSNNVLNQVNSITSMDISNNRIGGSNRYETNALVIDKFIEDNLHTVYLSKGLTLVDALAAGTIASTNNGVIILCNDNLTESQKSILSHINIKNVIEVGGGISRNLVSEIKGITN